MRRKSAQINHLSRDHSELSQSIKDKIRDAEEEKKRLLAILECMAEGVVAIDTEQKILLLNEALADKFALDSKALIGRFYWEILRDPQINSLLEKALQDRLPLRSEHTALLTETVFEVEVSPVFSGVHFLGIVAVFHDVTRIRELERVRREFVANVSHELKTPLTSIMGFVETLKEGAIEDEKNRKKFLQIIEEHALKLGQLIEDLLVLSKLESGKQETHHQIVEISELMGKVFELFHGPVRNKQLSVTTDFNPAIFEINGEAKALEQLFINLIDNAIKYNKENGTIHVHARHMADKSIIEIRDTGIGIPSGDLPRIFERFYRVDKSRARQTGGFGLGLSICKHIAESHAASIEVDSREGQGSVFRVSFPR